MRAATLIAIALMVGTARAQEKPAGGAPSAPKPAVELGRLNPLDGNWICKGATSAGAMGPGSPERKYASTFTIHRTLDGFAYTIAYDQKEATPPYSGVWNVAWDGEQNKLLLFWLDNVGNVGLETADDWNGDVLVAQGEGYVPAGFVPAAVAGTAAFRDTFTRKGDREMHWKGELKLHGMNTWTVIGEDDCMK